MEKKEASIGIFDSGIGGLSVWKEIVALLPNESVVYFADSAYCPYGSKTQEEIIQLSKRIVTFLIQNNVKLIVVACNTATAAAIDYLRESFDIPFVGMEPAIKPAALKTRSGVVGILATEGTFNGSLFNDTKKRYASHVDVIMQVGTGFVELVEEGKTNTIESKSIVKKVLTPLLEKGVDQLVLGCTHYPFLKDDIEYAAGDALLDIIDPAPAVARQTQYILKEMNSLNTSGKDVKYNFYSTKETLVLETMVSQWIENKLFDIQEITLPLL